MRQAFARFIALATIAAVMGCSSPPGPDIAAIEGAPVTPGKARFVIYYPKYWGGSGGLVQVRYRERPVSCRFDSGNYMVSEIEAGDQSVGFSFCGMAAISFLHLKAKDGAIYYFRVRPYDSSITGMLAGYPSEALKPGDSPHKGPFLIERVEESKALEEMQPLTQSKEN